MAKGFEGMDALIAEMRKLPDHLKNETEKTLEGVTNGMVAAVRQRYAYKAGKLVRGVGKRRLGPLKLRVYSRAPHVHLYEMGSYKPGARFQKDPRKSTGEMPANPVFIPEAIKARKLQLKEHDNMLRRTRVKGMEGTAK